MAWGIYLLLFCVALAMTATAVYAFQWAARKGQFKDFEKGAESIFDDEEPIGRPTDSFPGQKPPDA